MLPMHIDVITSNLWLVKSGRIVHQGNKKIKFFHIKCSRKSNDLTSLNCAQGTAIAGMSIYQRL